MPTTFDSSLTRTITPLFDWMKRFEASRMARLGLQTTASSGLGLSPLAKARWTSARSTIPSRRPSMTRGKRSKRYFPNSSFNFAGSRVVASTGVLLAIAESSRFRQPSRSRGGRTLWSS